MTKTQDVITTTGISAGVICMIVGTYLTVTTARKNKDVQEKEIAELKASILKDNQKHEQTLSACMEDARTCNAKLAKFENLEVYVNDKPYYLKDCMKDRDKMWQELRLCEEYCAQYNIEIAKKLKGCIK